MPLRVCGLRGLVQIRVRPIQHLSDRRAGCRRHVRTRYRSLRNGHQPLDYDQYCWWLGAPDWRKQIARQNGWGQRERC